MLFLNCLPDSRENFISAGIYDELDAQVEGTGVSIECLGGGKIDHNPAEKSITVFGLSQVGTFFA